MLEGKKTGSWQAVFFWNIVAEEILTSSAFHIPQNLVKNKNSRKNEVLLGLNLNEGTFILIYSLPGPPLAPRHIPREAFLYQMALMFPTSKEVQREVTRLYTGSFNPTDGAKNRDGLAEVIGDTMFICPVQDFAKE